MSPLLRIPSDVRRAACGFARRTSSGRLDGAGVALHSVADTRRWNGRIDLSELGLDELQFCFKPRQFLTPLIDAGTKHLLLTTQAGLIDEENHAGSEPAKDAAGQHGPRDNISHPADLVLEVRWHGHPRSTTASHLVVRRAA